ncbi:MAG: DUF6880 family protein [bacterium]
MTISKKLKKIILDLPRKAAMKILLELNGKIDQNTLAKKILELIDTWLPEEYQGSVIQEFQSVLREEGLKLLAAEFESRLNVALARNNEYLAADAYFHLCDCLEIAEDADEYLRIFKTYEIINNHEKIRLACLLNKLSRAEEAMKILEEPHFSFHSEIERLAVIANSYNLIGDHNKAKENSLEAFNMMQGADLNYVLEFLIYNSDGENLDKITQIRHEEMILPWLYEYKTTLKNALKILDPEYPLGATLMYRRLVQEALQVGNTQKYNKTALYIVRLDDLNLKIQDWKDCTQHDVYFKQLKEIHNKKISFWDKYNLLKAS